MKLKDDQVKLAYGAGQIDPVSIHIGGAIILAIYGSTKNYFIYFTFSLYKPPNINGFILTFNTTK